MSDRETIETMARILERFRRLPFLSDFSTPAEADRAGADDLNRTFARLAELVGASREPLSVRFRLVGADARPWHLDAGPDGCRASTEESTQRPDVEGTFAPPRKEQ